MWSGKVGCIECASALTIMWCAQAGDAAMVLSLSGLQEVEDRNLLAGSLMVLLEQDYNQAQVRLSGELLPQLSTV